MFDKAAFHLMSVREQGLPEHQASVHIGLFFGWAVLRGLSATWLEDRTPQPFDDFRARRITGPTLVGAWDGALLDDMLSDEGLAFTASYYGATSTGSRRYLDDYAQALGGDDPSPFHVADDWDTFEAVCRLLDERHGAWRPTWDPSAARLDLRDQGRPRSLPKGGCVPVVPVSGGVALPHGPLGIRAGGAITRSSLLAARQGDGWVALFPTLTGAKPRGVEDLGPVGVWASIEDLAEVDDEVSTVLACGDRVIRTRWCDEAAWSAEVRIAPPPEVSGRAAALLETLHRRVAEHVRVRRNRGERLGLLALAASRHGSDLVDLAAREAELTFEEQLLVLEDPDLTGRAEVVLAALERVG